MKTLLLLGLLLNVATAVAAAEPNRPVALNVTCEYSSLSSEPPVIAIVCVVQDDPSPLPPTSDSGDGVNQQPPGSVSSAVGELQQQEGRRLPGGLAELDVKKSD